MNRTAFSALLLSCSLGAALSAQVVVPLSPHDTFFRTNSDPAAVDAFALPIFALGVRAGDYLRLRAVGDWNNGVNGDVMRDLVGVFAGSGTLQPATLQQRLTSPVAAGPAYVPTGGTAVGNLPTDIAEDFWISRTGYGDQVLVRVPAGGSDLFICVPDAFYSDNSDPDGDFGVEVTLAPGPNHPGSGEDIELGTSVGAAALDTFDLKTVTAGNIVNIAIRSPFDTQAGNPFAILLDIATTAAGAPVGAFPHVWLSAAATDVRLGVLPAGAPTTTLSVTVPAGYAGFSGWLQGGTLWSFARNGTFLATDAHEIRAQ